MGQILLGLVRTAASVHVSINHPVSMGYLILTITQGFSAIDEQIRYQPADGDFQGQPNQPLKL